MYTEMVSKGIRPDVVTYNTLLTGVFQVGRVGDARKLFDWMKSNKVVMIQGHILHKLMVFVRMVIFQKHWNYFMIWRSANLSLTLNLLAALLMVCVE